MKCGTIIITLTFIMNFTGGELVSPWSFEDDIAWFILSFVLVFWWWYCVIYFIICALNCGKYRHIGSMFCTLVDSNIRLHSGQNAVDSQIIAKWVRNKFQTTVTECNITANCGIKKRFWCCSLICSLGTHLVTISSGPWQLHMYKKMFR